MVHILNGEGYKGSGLDLRSRKIWKTLGNDLRVETIVPSLSLRYPAYNFFIGNHSDELTPWIPVLAALNSEDTQFFVLPCCPFQFKSKFHRKNQNVSLYRDYLDYVKMVGKDCGFEMEEDRLKIPSTKRICFVGRTRRDAHRIQVVKEKAKALIESEVNSKENFVPRSSEIKVRNCTKVKKSTVENILQTIVNSLLKLENPVQKVITETDRKLLIEDSNLDWNCGSDLHLNEVAALISNELLTELKSESGGLQTLFRNHNFIFIVDKGRVRLRCHSLDSPEAGKRKGNKFKKENRKKKICWFFEHHPQGCPVPASQCLFAHGDEDLLLK